MDNFRKLINVILETQTKVNLFQKDNCPQITIPEGKRERWEPSEQNVRDVLKDKLQMAEEVIQSININLS